jgi:hypothetical protein
MVDDEKEYAVRKKAIFDGMSKRGQERILRMGYDKWDPFQEPKDPRDRLFSSVALNVNALLRDFYQAYPHLGQSETTQKDLFDLCSSLLRGESHARLILEFCCWYKGRMGSS